jgi:Cell wall hydrolyses involved in spore germination
MKKIICSLVIIFLIIAFVPSTVNAKSITENDNSTNLYNEKEKVVQVLSYKTQKISISSEDIYLMAQVVYAESRAEPSERKVAVASVILNRLMHPDFPKTIDAVIKQKGAFSCISNGKIDVIPNCDCYNAVVEALKGKDPTNNAVFFYNPKTATSRWMKDIGKNNVKPIGNHVFFVVK